MSASLRFLAVAVLAWAGVRAATLGIVPGAEVFAPAEAEAAPPPIVPTEFAPLPPVQPPVATTFAPYPPTPLAIPVYYYPVSVPPSPPSAPAPARYAAYTPLALDPGPVFYSEIPSLDEWPLSSVAAPDLQSGRRSSPALNTPQAPPRLDRLQLTSWALLRGQSGSDSLASGGTLGGSQAGARLTYAFTPRIAASLRTSAPVGGSRGGEVAAGVRLKPFRAIPLAITAERRQRFGRMSTGRNAFAIFAEGGVYQLPLPYEFALDAYGQAGVVGLNSRDLFADGALTVMRPVFGRVSIGFGTWGGAQPGLYRVDAGPRLSMRVKQNMRIDLDWRQRLAGDAEPGSGPAVTLAADF